jgi:hypothetical protein
MPSRTDFSDIDTCPFMAGICLIVLPLPPPPPLLPSGMQEVNSLTSVRLCVCALSEYPNLSNYVRDLYQTPGIRESINMKHIKTHYFTSHPRLNYYAIIPVGNGA